MIIEREISRREYVSRINRVIDYIEQNIREEMNVDELASIACFSKFHFHRIFSSVTGETLGKFILRLRLERAAGKLAQNPLMSITDISFDSCFNSPSTFSRAFKDYFQMTPTEWREQYSLFKANMEIKDSNLCTVNSNFQQAEYFKNLYFCNVINHNINGNVDMKSKLQFSVEVKEMPEMTVAYVRHIGPYKGDSKLFEGLYNKLFQWAGPRGLLRFPETKTIAVYHDDPEITEETKLRVSACITVPTDCAVDGEIGKMVIPGGKYAVGRFEISEKEFQEAWGGICGSWLPGSGYQFDDRLSYELYLNDHREHPEGKFIVDICLPVKPL